MDKHAFYQQAVQCVEAEIDFVTETFRQLRQRPAVSLREDFCGTAQTTCEWVKRGDDHQGRGEARGLIQHHRQRHESD